MKMRAVVIVALVAFSGNAFASPDGAEEPERSPYALPVSTIAAGAVITLLGVPFSMHARAAVDDYVDLRDSGGLENPVDARERLIDEVDDDNARAAAFYITGGVVTAVGVGLLIHAAASEPADDGDAWGVGPTTDGGATVWYSGTF